MNDRSIQNRNIIYLIFIFGAIFGLIIYFSGDKSKTEIPDKQTKTFVEKVLTPLPDAKGA